MQLDNLLRLAEVESITARKKSALYNDIKNGTFPAPVRLGARSVRWKLSEVQEWISNLSKSDIGGAPYA